jgi:hypothetical protein
LSRPRGHGVVTPVDQHYERGEHPIGAPARTDALRGEALAGRWCATRHVLAPGRGDSVPQGPANLLIADRVRAFLSHRYGATQDLSLTGAEIDDPIDCLARLRRALIRALGPETRPSRSQLTD